MADTQYVWMLGPGETKPVQVPASDDAAISKLMYEGFKQTSAPTQEAREVH